MLDKGDWIAWHEKTPNVTWVKSTQLLQIDFDIVN